MCTANEGSVFYQVLWIVNQQASVFNETEHCLKGGCGQVLALKSLWTHTNIHMGWGSSELFAGTLPSSGLLVLVILLLAFIFYHISAKCFCRHGGDDVRKICGHSKAEATELPAAK